MVEDKEIVLAIFGATFAIAGLLLVFLGFLLSEYGSFSLSDTVDETLAPYRRMIFGTITVLAINLILALLSFWWLMDEPRIAFDLTVGVFVFELITLHGLGVLTAWLMLWR